jgi:hypothetical protein
VAALARPPARVLNAAGRGSGETFSIKGGSNVKRTLLLAATIWFVSAGVSHALVLKVRDEGSGNVELRVAMSNEDYKAAMGMMGGANQVVDSDIPGMNDMNFVIPLTAKRYGEMQARAAGDAATGTPWCVKCSGGDGKTQFEVKAIHAFGAAMIGTKQCLDKTKSPDLTIPGSGSCALDGN